ncbi:4'-phosphopantetheinyl transferase superfamily protein [Pontibacter sp. HSC-14F20]|uniref:4'-phosphopantetheinyl transferase superfamily protein n=1 Tax=Pontibacter sp. HSC-14F20 TaxID=2864136 RepID=UPI001C7393F4|nr:4'-phosphopantetheinyl transferase superfamily protein [Pontibacter sp. HSC-14F20]MBX0334577.1 4'-phosphopantetheinyl transferase superfamily protein [Pontibacter sp. HSC-14F20]
MPLLQTRELDSYTLLGVWLLDEAPDALRLLLPAHLIPDESLQLAHPRRQREWLASRALTYQLLQHFTSEPLPLLRDATGKPVFAGTEFQLSITHSSRMAAVILSEKYDVGIDIELVSAKALRVADKFLTDQEKVYTADDEQQTCLYWSAKETLYKMYSQKRLIFKENLLVEPSHSPENNLLQGHVITDNFSKLYQIHHEVLHNHVLTYSVDR